MGKKIQDAQQDRNQLLQLANYQLNYMDNEKEWISLDHESEWQEAVRLYNEHSMQYLKINVEPSFSFQEPFRKIANFFTNGQQKREAQVPEEKEFINPLFQREQDFEYFEELCLLKRMGFTDTCLLKDLLIKYEGKVHGVI